jgi:hypothetical protein
VTDERYCLVRLPSSAELETDKLTAEFSIRIPEITSEKIRALPKAWKKELNVRLLRVMDQTIHEASYVPGKYLRTEDE